MSFPHGTIWRVIIDTITILRAKIAPTVLYWSDIFMVQQPFEFWQFPAIDCAPQPYVTLYQIYLHDSDSHPERVIRHSETLKIRSISYSIKNNALEIVPWVTTYTLQLLCPSFCHASVWFASKFDKRLPPSCSLRKHKSDHVHIPPLCKSETLLLGSNLAHKSKIHTKYKVNFFDCNYKLSLHIDYLSIFKYCKV